MTEPPEVFHGLTRRLDFDDTQHKHTVWYYHISDQDEPYAKLSVVCMNGDWTVRLHLLFYGSNVEIAQRHVYYVDNARNINPQDLVTAMYEVLEALRSHLRRAQTRLDALDALPPQSEGPTLWDRLEAP